MQNIELSQNYIIRIIEVVACIGVFFIVYATIKDEIRKIFERRKRSKLRGMQVAPYLYDYLLEIAKWTECRGFSPDDRRLSITGERIEFYAKKKSVDPAINVVHTRFFEEYILIEAALPKTIKWISDNKSRCVFPMIDIHLFSTPIFRLDLDACTNNLYFNISIKSELLNYLMSNDPEFRIFTKQFYEKSSHDKIRLDDKGGLSYSNITIDEIKKMEGYGERAFDIFTLTNAENELIDWYQMTISNYLYYINNRGN